MMHRSSIPQENICIATIQKKSMLEICSETMYCIDYVTGIELN